GDVTRSLAYTEPESHLRHLGMECTVASEYVPPVSDYRFLFGEAFGLDLVARGTGGAFSADDATEIIAGAGEFAASVLAPLETIGDREGARIDDGQVHLPAGFADAYQAFVEAGWITAE